MKSGHPHTPDSRTTKPGDRIGAEALFRAHATFVAAFLGRLGVPAAEIDDLVQEVFLVVHRKGGYEQGPAAPRSWLGAIAVRLARGRHRSAGRKREHGDEPALQAAVSPTATPAEQLEARQALDRVQRALDTLDLEHRAAFVLYEIEGQSCQDIAGSFGVPVGTVYSRLHSARRRFLQAHGAQAPSEPAADWGGAPVVESR